MNAFVTKSYSCSHRVLFSMVSLSDPLAATWVGDSTLSIRHLIGTTWYNNIAVRWDICQLPWTPRAAAETMQRPWDQTSILEADDTGWFVTSSFRMQKNGTSVCVTVPVVPQNSLAPSVEHKDIYCWLGLVGTQWAHVKSLRLGNMKSNWNFLGFKLQTAWSETAKQIV